MKKILLTALLVTPFVIAGPALAKDHEKGPRGGEDKFAAADANNDGVISYAEMTAKRDTRFADTDTNDDGMISLDEALAAAPEDKGKRTKGRDGKKPSPDKVFKMMDIDSDGLVSPEEVEVLSDRKFKDMDSNLDGNVTLLEAKAAKREEYIKRKASRK